MPSTPGLNLPDALAAATSDDPHSDYRRLSARGLFFDSRLNCWVAASSATVSAALSCPALNVRPFAEPVPAALAGTGSAAEVFTGLVRMNDGTTHARLKAAIQSVLDGIDAPAVLRGARALTAWFDLPAPWTGSAITRFNYGLPTVVLAQWFGIPERDWPWLIDEVLAFVRCIAPGGTPEEIAAGSRAADRLSRLIQQQLAAPGPLLQQLVAAIEQTGLPDGARLARANAIGLWFQACEGTAGLIGQALQLGLSGQHDGCAAQWVEQVLADLAPIQNTRRFIVTDVALAGCALHAGEALLAVLVGADETAGQNFAFGHGVHACPGADWARSIALAGVEHLLRLGVNESALASWRWRRSVNARVPEFD